MQPLGVVVIGGLTLGTLVTLILIPTMYSIIKRVPIPKKNVPLSPAPITPTTQTAPPTMPTVPTPAESFDAEQKVAEAPALPTEQAYSEAPALPKSESNPVEAEKKTNELRFDEVPFDKL